MNVFIEIIMTILVVILQSFKAVLFCIIPAPKKSVDGEIVLVTGAGSGLGRLMALEFSKLGATIVAWDVNQPGNEETAKQVKELGGKAYTYNCDISKREEVYAVADKVRQDVGDVTILVNNAGIVTGKRFMECPDAMIAKTLEVNGLAHFWTTKAFLPSMMRNNHGHVVCIASMAGIIGCNVLVDYCAAKFCNVGMMESLALELNSDGHTGIKTTTVCPYFIDTGMFDGCQTRFPAILPVLEPKPTVDVIMNAVLTNQEIVYIPKIMYLFAFLKSFMNAQALLPIARFFGATTFMATFTGRQAAEKAAKKIK